jgi:AraC-like DNA-binding protein
LIDPLAQVVALLQPRAGFSKAVSGAGSWRVRPVVGGQPTYCAVLDGACRLTLEGHATLVLQAGDFVLIPSTRGFMMSSLAPPPEDVPDSMPVPSPLATYQGEFRLGDLDGAADVHYLVGRCIFGSPDAALLVPLLPRLVHVRGQPRLATLVQLVREESRAARPAREVILERLLEVLLIEALRCEATPGESTPGESTRGESTPGESTPGESTRGESTPGKFASPGLLRGLADERLALAIRRMHEDPARPWTVTQLAAEAALSRSAFFARFNRAVGMAPMAYLLAWRMALGKSLLRHNEGGIADVAQRVGYGSASAFSVAFTRHVGLPPTHYAREQAPAGESAPVL